MDILNKAVIGLGFGDEGKGLTTEFLCSKEPNPLVIRYSGGHQAGHTVVKDNVKHVFAHFGSGTLSGTDTYWSKFCTVDPIKLIEEYATLKGYGIQPTIYIDSRCPVTTPYDVCQNRTLELKNSHGSCGMGFGSTIQREEDFYSLTFMDLFHPNVLQEKMHNIQNYYDEVLFFDNKMIDDFLYAVRDVINNEDIILSYGIPDNVYNKYIFESSQGLLLDQHIGFFPNVTRSDLGTKRIMNFTENVEIFAVTRAYQTRHGNGMMSNEQIPHNIKLDSEETNITNTYQGDFRRTILDLDLLLYGIRKDTYLRDNRHNLVITCLDHVEDEYRFTHQGSIVYCNDEYDFINKINFILKFDKIYISRSNKSENIESFI